MGRLSALFFLLSIGAAAGAGLVEEAAQLAGEGKYDEARGLLEQRIADDPADRAARLKLINVLISGGYLEEAEGALEHESKLAGPDPEVLNEKGRLFFKRGRYAQAIEAFSEAVEKDPGNLKALHNLGAAREKAGDGEGAREALRRALAIDSGSVESLSALGMLEVREGRFKEGAELLRRAEDQAPGNFDVLYGAGMVFGLAGDNPRSADYLCKAVGVRPADARLRSEYARALIRMEEYAAAEIELAEALRLSPDSSAAILGLGLLREEQGLREQAAIEYGKVDPQDEGYAEAAFRLGNLSLAGSQDAMRRREPQAAQERIRFAIGHYRRAIAADGGYQEARYNLILALLQSEEMQEAVKEAQELVRVTPDKAAYQMLLGAVFGQLGRGEEALRAFRRATELEEGCLECWMRLGNLTLRTGSLAEAAQAFRRAIALDEENPAAHYSLGQVRFRQGEMKQAKRSMRRVLELRPEDLAAINSLANICMRLRDMDGASEYIGRGVDIDPSYLPIFRTAELLYAQSLDVKITGSSKSAKMLMAYLRGLRSSKKNPAEAAQAFESMLALDPAATAAHLKLGVLKVVGGEVPAGIRHLEEARNLVPSDAEIHYALATGYYNLAEGQTGAQASANYEKAYAAYHQAARVSPQYAEAYWGMGSVLYRMGRYAEARRDLERCLEINPFFSEAYNTLGSAVARQAEKAGEAEKTALLEEAVEFYRQALRANPNAETAHYNLGTMYHELKRYPEAIEEYEAALRLDPGFALARYRLARLYAERNKWPFDRGRAEKEFGKLMEMQPGNCGFMYDFGAFYFNTRSYEKAKETWREVASLCPDFRPARDGLKKLLEMGY